MPALAETLFVVAMALLLGTLLLCAAVSAQVWRARSGATTWALALVWSSPAAIECNVGPSS